MPSHAEGPLLPMSASGRSLQSKLEHDRTRLKEKLAAIDRNIHVILVKRSARQGATQTRCACTSSAYCCLVDKLLICGVCGRMLAPQTSVIEKPSEPLKPTRQLSAVPPATLYLAPPGASAVPQRPKVAQQPRAASAVAAACAGRGALSTGGQTSGKNSKQHDHHPTAGPGMAMAARDDERRANRLVMISSRKRMHKTLACAFDVYATAVNARQRQRRKCARALARWRARGLLTAFWAWIEFLEARYLQQSLAQEDANALTADLLCHENLDVRIGATRARLVRLGAAERSVLQDSASVLQIFQADAAPYWDQAEDDILPGSSPAINVSMNASCDFTSKRRREPSYSSFSDASEAVTELNETQDNEHETLGLRSSRGAEKTQHTWSTPAHSRTAVCQMPRQSSAVPHLVLSLGAAAMFLYCGVGGGGAGGGCSRALGWRAHATPESCMAGDSVKIVDAGAGPGGGGQTRGMLAKVFPLAGASKDVSKGQRHARYLQAKAEVKAAQKRR